jgi:hypothetical protein
MSSGLRTNVPSGQMMVAVAPTRRRRTATIEKATAANCWERTTFPPRKPPWGQRPSNLREARRLWTDEAALNEDQIVGTADHNAVLAPEGPLLLLGRQGWQGDLSYRGQLLQVEGLELDGTGDLGAVGHEQATAAAGSSHGSGMWVNSTNWSMKVRILSGRCLPLT